MPLSAIFAISLGAVAGALLRAGLAQACNALFPDLPPGTLLANLLGAYLIGLALAVFAALPQLAALFAGETAVAGAGAMSAVANIPYVGPILAIAALASIVAAAATLPKFAEGGLAYGPTLGIFGEYPGAANNPEVVAPLNKLRDIIEPSSGFGQVEFKIDGYVLKGILRKVNRLDYRNNG